MFVHLFSTDSSCMELIDKLPDGDEVTCIIVPSNRTASEKVNRLVDDVRRHDLPVYVHKRSCNLESGLPPADAAISWMYSQIISTEDLNRYPAGIMNMHGGMIPAYRGASVLQWAIINGEDKLGITWHGLVEEVDAGPIWAESMIPIPPEATAADARREMICEGVQLFPQAWARFQDPDARPRYPDLSAGQVWHQRKPSDGMIGSGWSERRVRDTVRALCPPWPPAFIDVDGERVFIARVLQEPDPSAIPYPTAEHSTLYLCPLNRSQPRC